MMCTHVPDKRYDGGRGPKWRCSRCRSDGGDTIDKSKTWDELAGRKMICFICRDERNIFVLDQVLSRGSAMESSWAAYGSRRTPGDRLDYWYCGCDGSE
jgi:hypothetical protein